MKYILIYASGKNRFQHECPSGRWWEAMRFIEHGLGCKVLYKINVRLK